MILFNPTSSYLTTEAGSSEFEIKQGWVGNDFWAGSIWPKNFFLAKGLK